MKVNNYNIEKILDSLNNYGKTNFITQKELMLIKGKLFKNEYNIYWLYDECSKVILYKKDIPDIKLFKIKCKNKLRHQEILGTIFSLGIKEDTFGDIVKYNDEFYIFLLPHLVSYFTCNLTEINGNKIILEEVDIASKDKFIQDTVAKEYIVSSLRIDNIVSSITNCSRRDTLDKFKNNEVNLNYNDEIKPTRVLQEGDIFSIRRYGKFKFNKILKMTKKGGFIIEILIYK